MTVHVRVRADASGYYAHARGKVISDSMPREEAEEIIRTAINGREWEIAEVPPASTEPEQLSLFGEAA